MNPTVDPDARAAFARSWADAVSGTSYVSMSRGELESRLRGYTDRLVDELLADVCVDETARTVGADLVEAHFTDSATLGATVARLAELPLALGLEPDGARVGRMQGALADGYAAALRRRTLDEQEGIRRAAMAATADIERALDASEARFRAVFAGAPIGVGVGSVDGQILEVNESLQRMLGYTTAEFTQRSVSDFIHPDDAASVWQLYKQLVNGDRESFRVEKRFFHKDGDVIWTNLAVALLRDATGRPQYQVAMFEDITQRRRLQTRLAHAASHDALTGIANRAAVNEHLQRVFETADARSRVGVCFVDLDGFKAVNDSFGHATGDTLLAAVAGRLAEVASSVDAMAARLGGDEFVVVVEGTSGAEQIVAIAARLLAVLDDPFDVGDHKLMVSASVGVAERPVSDAAPSELLRSADAALRASKADGKGRWSLFDPARETGSRLRSGLAAAMPDALVRNQFRVDYQPIVALDSGGVTGVEALVRWRHPTRGTLAPSTFVPVAEETGAIVDIGRWVLTESCRQARRWCMQGAAVPMVSVNIAVRQLVDPRFVDDVVHILDDTGLDPGRLQLELTESAVVVAPGAPLDALHTLADRGVRLAIDDFGTGYSNLAYLRDLPLCGLKLAASFAAGMHSDGSVDHRIVAALVSLARSLHLTVTAEGIETAEQARLLREVGCDTGQGAHFGPAVAPEALASLPAFGAG